MPCKPGARRKTVMFVEIRNLTPHALNIVLVGGQTLTLPPSGIVPRRSVLRGAGDVLCPNDGEVVPVEVEALGEVEGLPGPEDDVVLVVSRLVAEAVPWRRDVYAPGEAVRDSGGRIIGARGLVRCVAAEIEFPVAWAPSPHATVEEHGALYRLAEYLPGGETGLPNVARFRLARVGG